MSIRAKIPMFAALGLSFTGCHRPDDPIVGHWSSFDVQEEEPGYSYSVAVDMVIHDDFTGLVEVTLSYDYPGTEYDYSEGYSLEIEAERVDSGKYKMKATNPKDPEFAATVNCVLTDALLCTDGDIVWAVKKED
ncbi:hypothetical protein [Nannocystis sp.]|uniref:hypothetical protein n=1 Tax=Nannocystis sp. TaxID=1962667 RepID=UPI0025DB730C|nr:hypothetical protein [Nannocystis sp.]MBK7824981.1 hypothetical protein [Nannocystis sp.]